MKGMTQKNIQSTSVPLTSLLPVTQTKLIFPTSLEHQLCEYQSSEPTPVKKKKVIM
jgi:CRISPR/Cas system CSM-associated protein Csm4 (group 5 of RAMP superfamily)